MAGHKSRNKRQAKKDLSKKGQPKNKAHSKESTAKQGPAEESCTDDEQEEVDEQAKKTKIRPPPLDLSKTKVKDDDDEDYVEPPDSADSVWSFPDLDRNHPCRWLPAQDVRSQIQQAPSERLSGTKYATTFRNDEGLVGLKSEKPRLEFPIQKDVPYRRGVPGPVRVIYPEDPEKRSQSDIIYHTSDDPAKWGRDLKFGNYRPGKKQ
ncbi:hypothetical protein F4811DRAFT_566630 [Daldinia bambusicola]|nr:hypothetical protein F4811DRAFT_566630 [Daldinia bambusicola]